MSSHGWTCHSDGLGPAGKPQVNAPTTPPAWPGSNPSRSPPPLLTTTAPRGTDRLNLGTEPPATPHASCLMPRGSPSSPSTAAQGGHHSRWATTQTRPHHRAARLAHHLDQACAEHHQPRLTEPPRRHLAPRPPTRTSPPHRAARQAHHHQLVHIAAHSTAVRHEHTPARAELTAQHKHDEQHEQHEHTALHTAATRARARARDKARHKAQRLANHRAAPTTRQPRAARSPTVTAGVGGHPRTHTH